MKRREEGARPPDAGDAPRPRPRTHPAVTELHRGGTGEPLVLLHGVTGTWIAWQPVIDALAAQHEVLALTLPGHLGGVPFEDGVTPSVAAMADALERRLDHHGIEKAHLVGNSLGGLLAMELARRGRALSLVCLSPAGAWESPADLDRVINLLLRGQRFLVSQRGRVEPLLRRPRFRRLALRLTMEHGERVPVDAIGPLLDGVIAVDPIIEALFDGIRDAGPLVHAPRPDCPVLIAWAEHDRTIPFARYGKPFIAAAGDGVDHVTLPGVGHVPMYDDPDLIVRTILSVTDPRSTNP